MKDDHGEAISNIVIVAFISLFIISIAVIVIYINSCTGEFEGITTNDERVNLTYTFISHGQIFGRTEDGRTVMLKEYKKIGN